MTSAASSFPNRLTEIDELTRPDHHYLSIDDRCVFLGDYTAREGWSYSVTNQLILNLKIDVSLREIPRWYYKNKAIDVASAALNQALNGSIKGVTFVPIPPSASRADPAYDDRMVRVLRGIRPGIDVRELVIQPQTRPPVHKSEQRLRPDEIEAGYALDVTCINPEPTQIVICDDVVTTGCQYVAMKSFLSKHFPAAKYFGLFIARRVPQSIEFEPVDDC